MNDKEKHTNFEYALKHAFEADFEKNCQSAAVPELDFLKKKSHRTAKQKRSFSFGKVAAVVVIALLGANMILLISNDSQSYGDKGILHRLYQGIAGVVTDSDEAISPDDEVEALTINSMDDIEKAKRFLPGLYVPQYIPEGYKLDDLSINKYADGDYAAAYAFSDPKGKTLGISAMFTVGDNSYASSGQGEMIEKKDRKIFISYDEVDEVYTATVYTETGVMDISGDLDKTELMRVAEGLEK